MGTRADFYVRKDSQMEWLGSIGWDGHPESIDKPVIESTSEQQYRKEVTAFFDNDRDDVTLPHNGWPWPWDDSRTTDYSYIFENGKVMASCFGYNLFDPLVEQKQEDSEEDEQKMQDYFPDMKAVKNVDFGKRSGLIITTPTTLS